MLPPVGMIWREMLAQRVVYVLGAGASLPHCPCVNCLTTGLKNRFGVDGDTLDKVASLVDEAPLKDYLMEQFSTSEPLPIHRLIALVPKGKLIITTNYDRMIESALADQSIDYWRIIYRGMSGSQRSRPLLIRHSTLLPMEKAVSCDSNEFHKMDLANHTVVFKIHGDWEYHPVITMEDYFDIHEAFARARIVPPSFVSHFYKCRFLFIGSSLSDWSLRLLLRLLKRPERLKGFDSLANRKSWMLTGPAESTTAEFALWDKLGVTLYQSTADEFVDRINALPPEVRETP